MIEISEKIFRKSIAQYLNNKDKKEKILNILRIYINRKIKRLPRFPYLEEFKSIFAHWAEPNAKIFNVSEDKLADFFDNLEDFANTLANFSLHCFSETKKYNKASRTVFEHIVEHEEIEPGYALFNRHHPPSEFMQCLKVELKIRGSRRIKEYFNIEDYLSRILRGQIKQYDSKGKLIQFEKTNIPSLSDKPDIYERWILKGWVLNKNYKDIESWDELLNLREKLITGSINLKKCKNTAMKLQKILQSSKVPLAKIEFKIVLCLEKKVISKNEARALLGMRKIIPEKIDINEYIKEILGLISDQEKMALFEYLTGSTSLKEVNEILEKIDMYYREKRVTPSLTDSYRFKREFMKALFEQLGNKEAQDV